MHADALWKLYLRSQFFGYWDVMGSHTDYIGTHHMADHKSGEIDIQVGWHMAGKGIPQERRGRWCDHKSGEIDIQVG